MCQHRGEILEAVVRKSGYSIKVLAERLGISRNTIYNKFREHNLSYDFILSVGNIIHYDFTCEYPEIKTTVSVDKDQRVAELWRLRKRYTHLLERYQKLLSFLIGMANDYHLERLKKEVGKFLEQSP